MFVHYNLTKNRLYYYGQESIRFLILAAIFTIKYSLKMEKPHGPLHRGLGYESGDLGFVFSPTPGFLCCSQ